MGNAHERGGIQRGIIGRQSIVTASVIDAAGQFEDGAEYGNEILRIGNPAEIMDKIGSAGSGQGGV